MATLEKKSSNSSIKQVHQQSQQSQSQTNSPKQPLVHQKKFSVSSAQNEQMHMQISTEQQSDNSSLNSVDLDPMG